MGAIWVKKDKAVPDAQTETWNLKLRNVAELSD